jgi:hypothetical protein
VNDQIVISVLGKRADIGLRVGMVTTYAFSPHSGSRFESECVVTRIVSRRRRRKGQHDIYLQPVAQSQDTSSS